jgi:hypothetical protein
MITELSCFSPRDCILLTERSLVGIQVQRCQAGVGEGQRGREAREEGVSARFPTRSVMDNLVCKDQGHLRTFAEGHTLGTWALTLTCFASAGAAKEKDR